MAAKLATQKAAEAFDTIGDFLLSFEDLDDPRQRAKVRYRLDEVLLLVLLGVIAKFGDRLRGRSRGSAASGRSRTRRHRTINVAIFSLSSAPSIGSMSVIRGSASPAS